MATDQCRYKNGKGMIMTYDANKILLDLEKNDSEDLQGFLTNDKLPVDLVSAYAGDRPLSEADQDVFDFLLQHRGKLFFSDLLFTLAHRDFPPEVAEDLWNQILRHKFEMSSLMKRNIRISVATLDYLSNLKTEMPSATVIDEAQFAKILRLTQFDGLTGLYNHTCCYEKIGFELRRFARHGTIFSFMMIDIDNFKELNDKYGHTEGDNILAMVAAILKESIRDLDTCCRYGGEEFAVIMPSTDSGEAGILAERLREKVAQSLPNSRRVTVSIGVASCSDETFTDVTLVKKADNAMYQAKKNGKNRVVISRQ